MKIVWKKLEQNDQQIRSYLENSFSYEKNEYAFTTISRTKEWALWTMTILEKVNNFNLYLEKQFHCKNQSKLKRNVE